MPDAAVSYGSAELIEQTIAHLFQNQKPYVFDNKICLTRRFFKVSDALCYLSRSLRFLKFFYLVVSTILCCTVQYFNITSVGLAQARPNLSKILRLFNRSSRCSGVSLCLLVVFRVESAILKR